MSKRRYPNNALALAIANYVKVVESMSDPFAKIDSEKGNENE